MKLRQLFSRFEVPGVLVSNNGIQLTSVFSEFGCRFGVKIFVHLYTIYNRMVRTEGFWVHLKKALLTAKEDGKVREILDDFALFYRTFSNPSALNQLSPAEIMFGWKVEIALDTIKPKQNGIRRNRKMGAEFNNHHGTICRIFQNNQKVYVRDFRYSSSQWTSGCILKSQRNVMYVVEVIGQVSGWRQSHAGKYWHLTENQETGFNVRNLIVYFRFRTSSDSEDYRNGTSPIRGSLQNAEKDILQVDLKRRAYVFELRNQWRCLSYCF